MTLPITRHAAARHDLLQTFVYIGQDNVGAAQRFLDAVERDLARLSAFPGIGTLRQFTAASLVGVRSITVSGFRNYIIFYRATENELQVLRVLHGARDIDRAFGER